MSVDYGAWDEVERLIADRTEQGWQCGELINYHTIGCFGCGPMNTSGFGLQWIAAAEHGAVTCVTRFADRFMGWRGIMHGGAIAGVLDDALGAAMVRNLSPAMTKSLHVSFLAPVRLDVHTTVDASVTSQGGGEVVAQASISQDGERLAVAEGFFKEVAPEYLQRFRS